jgi:hypothetical protein
MSSCPIFFCDPLEDKICTMQHESAETSQSYKTETKD